MSIAKSLLIGKKSRSDGTLLTGGFNLRNRLNKPPPKFRRDDTLTLHSVVPAGLGESAKRFLAVD